VDTELIVYMHSKWRVLMCRDKNDIILDDCIVQKNTNLTINKNTKSCTSMPSVRDDMNVNSQGMRSISRQYKIHSHIYLYTSGIINTI